MAPASMIHPVVVSKVAAAPLAAILRASSCTCRSTRPTKGGQLEVTPRHVGRSRFGTQPGG